MTLAMAGATTPQALEGWGGFGDWLAGVAPVWQAALATLFTWLMTAAGATVVLAFRDVSRKVLDTMLGAAAGIMTAASCWSLLIPAIERGGIWPAVAGLGMGTGVLLVADRMLPHLHPFGNHVEGGERPQSWRRATLLVFAITIHNLPEGMAVGVGFAGEDLAAAVALAIGIGLQNLPEGLAVSLPLRREGMSRRRALFWGQLSGAIEPIGGIAGALLVGTAVWLLPYGLAFAAGAMLYVVIEELIPDATKHGNDDEATVGFIAGFAIMMTLDNVFG